MNPASSSSVVSKVAVTGMNRLACLNSNWISRKLEPRFLDYLDSAVKKLFYNYPKEIRTAPILREPLAELVVHIIGEHETNGYVTTWFFSVDAWIV